MSFDTTKRGDMSWAYKLRDKYLPGERRLPRQPILFIFPILTYFLQHYLRYANPLLSLFMTLFHSN